MPVFVYYIFMCVSVYVVLEPRKRITGRASATKNYANTMQIQGWAVTLIRVTILEVIARIQKAMLVPISYYCI